jgi:TRAP-type mannitol/chloroaromatic compound transport system permease small subunit
MVRRFDPIRSRQGQFISNSKGTDACLRRVLPLQALLKLSRGIDAINTRIGRWLAWLILVAVIVSSVNATVRKIFDVSSNAYLELQWVLFGIVFLLCSPWTLLENEHIRIDIINHSLPLKVRSWIDSSATSSSCCRSRSS